MILLIAGEILYLFNTNLLTSLNVRACSDQRPMDNENRNPTGLIGLNYKLCYVKNFILVYFRKQLSNAKGI